MLLETLPPYLTILCFLEILSYLPAFPSGHPQSLTDAYQHYNPQRHQTPENPSKVKRKKTMVSTYYSLQGRSWPLQSLPDSPSAAAGRSLQQVRKVS
ncbi:hypothetical protein Pmani_008027 [Petrolisthes manimaculis]|uniref:Uncharacterized protein n=1 Tax=Petrolisthes manimaculis TaxID=1843537 RepID=A0AAE1UF09_9EUCA|nr:hypothetical protein Pmani_008027 [Petrolisthes manimaculis]